MSGGEGALAAKRAEVLAGVESVPAMPAIVVKVRQLAADPDVDFGALARAVEHDPGLTADVLRLANSAYFGFAHTIGSVRQAVVRLGTQRIVHLVLTLAIAPIARKAVRGYDLPPGELWRHCIAVAIGAEKVASAVGRAPTDNTFTAGLLHDIGKIVLGSFVEVDADPIVEAAFEQGLSFDQAERDVLGIDHADVGGALLERWHLPPDIVEADRWHHRPEDCTQDAFVCDLVHVADALSMAAGQGTGADGLHYSVSARACERLGFTAEMAEPVLAEIMAGLDELRDLLAGPPTN
jgi:putative nucleotidyltransferase with HDIG domain